MVWPTGLTQMPCSFGRLLLHGTRSVCVCELQGVLPVCALDQHSLLGAQKAEVGSEALNFLCTISDTSGQLQSSGRQSIGKIAFWKVAAAGTLLLAYPSADTFHRKERTHAMYLFPKQTPWVYLGCSVPCLSIHMAGSYGSSAFTRSSISQQ